MKIKTGIKMKFKMQQLQDHLAKKDNRRWTIDNAQANIKIKLVKTIKDSA